jgi:hypothetical protein
VKIDVGIDHSEPGTTTGRVQRLAPNSGQTNQSVFGETDQLFAQALRTDAGAAVLDFADDEIRVLRNESLPAVGKEAVKSLPDSDHVKMTRKKSGGGSSLSNDLVWRYGTYPRHCHRRRILPDRLAP